ncbi:MAG: hypothetical protein OXT69_02365 [Candidatus Poribacteria bacterium]|nr:hypothetical protein [Candidatus Poribacteria bacterium]
MPQLILYLIGALVLIAWIGYIAWKRLVLRDEQLSEIGYSAPDAQLKKLAGSNGVALTDLRPAGAARIDGRRVDVVADSEYIAKDTPVQVVAVEGVRVVVEKLPLETNVNK